MPAVHQQQDKRRLFFALWPDAAMREQLALLQHAVSGRKVQPQNLHLTMAFLGHQPQSLLPALSQLLVNLPLTALTIQIDTYGYFQKQRIVWAGASMPPPSLFELQRALWDAIRQTGIPFQPLNGFKPHISLARDAEEHTGKLASVIDWQVQNIALLESVSDGKGVRYVPLAQRTF